jgi:hypothetical protein
MVPSENPFSFFFFLLFHIFHHFFSLEEEKTERGNRI